MTTHASRPRPARAVSAAERSGPARIGAVLFRNRSWLPVPFILAPLLLPGHQSVWQWVAAVCLIAAGEAIRLAGVAAAGTVTRRRSRHVQRLVTYGIFAWARNPLYTGNLLIWMAFVIISGVFWFLPIALALFMVEYALIVRYEEGVLESIFGREYLDYKAETPRWVPKVPGPRPSGPMDWREAWRSETSTFVQYVALAIVFALKGRFLN